MGPKIAITVLLTVVLFELTSSAMYTVKVQLRNTGKNNQPSETKSAEAFVSFVENAKHYGSLSNLALINDLRSTIARKMKRSNSKKTRGPARRHKRFVVNRSGCPSDKIFYRSQCLTPKRYHQLDEEEK